MDGVMHTAPGLDGIVEGPPNLHPFHGLHAQAGLGNPPVQLAVPVDEAAQAHR